MLHGIEKGAKGEAWMSLEKELNDVLSQLGNSDWTVVYSPDKTAEERAEVFQDDKIIIIHDVGREPALETLVHEYVEIQLRDVIRPYLVTVNALVKALEKIYYVEKEIAIKNLVSPILKSIVGEVKKKDEKREEKES